MVNRSAPSGARRSGRPWALVLVATAATVALPWESSSAPPSQFAQAGAAGVAPASRPSQTGSAAEPLGVTARARTNYYVDNDGNTVVTPLVTLEGALSERLSVAAHALVDVMTCASVDVVSSATPKGYFEETRQEAGATVTFVRHLLQLSAGAVASSENDYGSLTASFGAAHEFAARNFTAALGYAFTDSTVGRADDWRFAADLDSHAVTLTLTQVLSPRWIAQLALFGGALSGFLSSPYRMVRLADGAHSEESTPSLRLRSAVVLQVRGALSNRSFVAGSYRYYHDNWGIDGHTAEVSWTFVPRSWVELRLRNRFYIQDGAGFYRQVYHRPLRYMTADRELSAFHGDLIGAKLAFPMGRLGPIAELELDIKSDVMWQWFADFDALPMRRFLVTEVGFRVGF